MFVSEVLTALGVCVGSLLCPARLSRLGESSAYQSVMVGVPLAQIVRRWITVKLNYPRARVVVIATPCLVPPS